MTQLWENFVTARLAVAVSDTDTVLTLRVGEGDDFPIYDAGDYSSLVLEDENGAKEVAYVTGRTGDDLTVERAREGTIARAYAIDSRVEIRLTAAALQAYIQRAEGADPGNPLTQYLLEVQPGAGTTVDNSDPQRPIVAMDTGGEPIDSPLTTQGDLWGFDVVDTRVPVGPDNTVLVADSTALPGVTYKKIMDIPLDPDDPDAGFPGEGSGGIATPLNPPVRPGDVVTYTDTDGTQGGDSPTLFLVGDMRVSTDSSGTLIVETDSGGTAAVEVRDGSATLALRVGGGQASIEAIGVPLAIDSDTPFPTNGNSRQNAVALDGFRMPPGDDAWEGASVQVSNTLDTTGSPTVGVFDQNTSDNPGGSFGSSVTGV